MTANDALAPTDDDTAHATRERLEKIPACPQAYWYDGREGYAPRTLTDFEEAGGSRLKRHEVARRVVVPQNIPVKIGSLTPAILNDLHMMTLSASLMSGLIMMAAKWHNVPRSIPCSSRSVVQTVNPLAER